MKFCKPALSIDNQIAFLKEKGLNIDDEDRAKRYLANIGLFRLKAYRQLFYLPETKQFRPEATFSDVLDLYIFDRKIRILTFDALERIEIAIRSAISNVMSEAYGPHWFLIKNVFHRSYYNEEYNNLISNMKNCTGKNGNGRGTPSCESYYRNHEDPELPPSWIVIEVLSMSTWSKVYQNIRKTKLKKKISDPFGFDKDDFGHWIHALSKIRNICAHHDRLWNRSLKPTAAKPAKYTHPGMPTNKPYTNFAMIYAFLKSFTHTTTWNEKLFNLMDSKEDIDVRALMGFPVEWYEFPFWQLA